MSNVRRFFAPVGGGQVHYRRMGHGPVLVLLPPLPQSSGAVTPLAERLAFSHEVLIVDPPGYGLSDPPGDGAGGGLFDVYGRPVLELLQTLGVGRFGLVGCGVGAVLALTLACEARDRLTGLVLDFDGALEVDETISDPEAELPSVAPRRDGGHLLTLWDMARSGFLFAPWNSGAAARRLRQAPPNPGAIEARLLDGLRAGESYAGALKAARRVDVGALLLAQQPPPLILDRRSGGLDRARIMDGAAGPLRAVAVADGWEDAAKAILAVFEGRGGSSAAPAADVAQTAPGAQRLQNAFLEVPGGQMLARLDLAGQQGPPLLGLHDPAGSSRRLTGVLAPFVGRRPVVALDLPGSGESDRLLGPDLAIEDYARWSGFALDALGIERCDVMGRYSGGQVGLELSLMRPQTVRRIIHYGIQIFEADEKPALLEHYAPSLEPRWDGAHLVTAWAILRDMSLFWPWFNRSEAGIVWRDAAIDAEAIHARVVDLLKMGDLWRSAYAASFNYPMQARMAAATAPSLFADMPGSASHARLASAVRATARGQARDLLGPPAAWTEVFDSFLDADL